MGCDLGTLLLSMRKVRQALQQVVKQPWMKTFMRLGYAAKGILYLFIGLLAGPCCLASPCRGRWVRISIAGVG